MSAKNKLKLPIKRVQSCQNCKEKIENDNYYLCSCGYQMCWDCYDDFNDDEDPFCPKCDAELISDSEDESTSKQNPTITQARQKSPPSITKQVSVSNKSNITNNTDKTASATTASINSNNFNYNDLAKVRVIKKNLVYVIGLSPEIANEETLLKKEYFSQYGKVTKIVVNTNNAYNPKSPNGPSYSAYLTFSNEREASMAILGTEEFQINDRIIRASYGTTKYCSYFLKQQECPNLPDCLYLHSYGKDKEFFSKDETISNKNIFIDQQKMAIKNIQKYVPDLIKIKNTVPNYVSVLPSPQKIIEKLIEQDVLDIKQKPADTPQNDKKEDKKKKEDNTPFMDQWGMDFSIPTPPPNKKDDKIDESPSYIEIRKQSQSVSLEKELTQHYKTTSPSLNKSISTQQDPSLSSLQFKNRQETKKESNNKGSTLEDNINSKEDQQIKLLNEISNNQQQSPKNSCQVSDTQFLNKKEQVKQSSKAPQTILEMLLDLEQNIPVNKTQTGILNNTQTNQIANKSQNQPTESSKKQTNKNVLENSPYKDQNLKENNEEKQKEDLQTDIKKKTQNSLTNLNQAGEVTNDEHSRTSSINQKNATQLQSTSQSLSASQINGNASTSNKLNNNTSNQNGNYYEKKDPSKKDDSKFQKHQYIPVNQSNKQTNQTIEAQKDNQNQQQKEESKLTKSQSANTQKNRLSQQQTATINNLLSQNSQTINNASSLEINNENINSSQLNSQIASNQQQTSNQQNPHLHQFQSNDQQTDNTQSKIQTVNGSVSPKYKLEKVQKLEKTLSSDNEIMKRLLIRTSQKNSQSRFDFAKNSENSNQPVEDIDMINNIFKGQYIILTKSQSTKQFCTDKNGY